MWRLSDDGPGASPIVAMGRHPKPFTKPDSDGRSGSGAKRPFIPKQHALEGAPARCPVMGATNIRKPRLQQDQAGPTRHANFSSGCTIADGVETADLKAAKTHLNSLQ